ncbi:ribbon-helix-helix domain-containing protein [Pseudomonas shirazica]|uniref:ribbon-helix-helix domain-containing protein n=1 Tax=Pseudomonas TaxID=286 RepID=UPI001C2779C0|nr:ribbon-helix-helix domain-containing protein [Pseudomonas shirazica]
MKNQVKQNKDLRVTIRLTRSELQILEAKMTEAGYKSASAFIRDFVANGQVKPKVTQDVVQIARELMNLASMINSDRPGSELREKVKYIAQVNLEGVQ